MSQAYAVVVVAVVIVAVVAAVVMVVVAVAAVVAVVVAVVVVVAEGHIQGLRQCATGVRAGALESIYRFKICFCYFLASRFGQVI